MELPDRKILPILLILVVVAGYILFLPEPPERHHFELKEGLFMVEGNSIKAVVPPTELRFEVLTAIVTAYNPVPEQTDSTPFIMASENMVYDGAIACPSWIPFGTTIEIDNKTYICEDRTNPKHDGIFDILMFNYKKAKEFGRQIKEVRIY